MINDIDLEKLIEIKQLQKEISEVKSEVILYNTMHESLVAKQASCVDVFNNAEHQQKSVLSNLKQLNLVVSTFKNIERSSAMLKKQSKIAYDASCKTPEKLKETVDALIDAISHITELQNFVDQQLEPNEYGDISTYLHEATTDASAAVTATLTAMTSSYKSMIANDNVSNISTLEYKQVQNINHLLIGDLSEDPDNKQKLKKAIDSLEKSREALINAHNNYIEIVDMTVNIYVEDATSDSKLAISKHERHYKASQDDIAKLIKQVFKDYETVKKLSQKKSEKSMLNQLNSMYEKALKNYQMQFQVYNTVNQQLQDVGIKLAHAKNKQESLIAGLEAAKMALGVS